MRLQLLLVAASFAMAIPALADEIPTEIQSNDNSSQELFIANKSVASDLGSEITPDQTIFNANSDQPDFNSKNTPQLSQGFGSLYTRTAGVYIGGSIGPMFGKEKN